MTALQLVIACGLIFGLGLALIVAGLVRTQPDLGDVLARLDARPNINPSSAPTSGPASLSDRLGTWGMRRLPGGMWRGVDEADLELMQIPLARFYGQKVLGGLFGLAAVPLVAWAWSMVTHVSLVASVLLTLIGGAVGFYAPGIVIKSQAKERRTEFTRALSTFADLIALGRMSSGSLMTAIPSAAEVATSWPFQRLAAELRYAHHRRIQPWVALEDLSRKIAVPQLSELADVLRLAGEDSAQIAKTLQAQASSLRNAVLHEEIDEANAISERMTLPQVGLFLVLVLLLSAPSLLRIGFQMMSG